jgi:uncharacterized protein YcbX
MITIAGIHVYPVKSCRGLDLQRARLTREGLEHDREWMIVTTEGRFLTQREAPRLARIEVQVGEGELRLAAEGAGTVAVPLSWDGDAVEVDIWGERCLARDQGQLAAGWLSELLGRRVGLVRFDPRRERPSDPEWTGDAKGYARFADGYAMLVISRASLADLNRRLEEPLPMNRFRPNLVLEGLGPYAEDELGDFGADGVRLRGVKPCTRCRVTTTDQSSGELRGDEPLRTLKTYRWDARLRGVKFGQNVIVLQGAGAELCVGQVLEQF